MQIENFTSKDKRSNKTQNEFPIIFRNYTGFWKKED